MKVLLYSGGMDSWLIDKLWKPDVKLYIDIHGEYSEAEKKRLPDDVQVVDFPLLGKFELANRFVPMRNLYFLMLASHYGNDICLGATAGDGGKDKSESFLCTAEHIIADLWHDKKVYKDVRVEKSFVRKSKAELVQEYLHNGGTLEEIRRQTFSCYSPINQGECFACYPCFRKFAILYALGCEYPMEQKRAMWAFIQKHIIPTREQGGYEGTYYTDRGDESFYLVRAVQKLRAELGAEK